jgi:CHAD domain-containing protein
VVPAEADLSELEERLSDQLGLEEGDQALTERSWTDTFDWRLHRAGLRLVAEPHDGRLLLSCTAMGSSEGTQVSRLRLNDLPRFAWDLPPSELRQTIEGAVAMRALLPRVMVRSVARTLTQRDRNGKIVVRLTIETPSVITPQGELPMAPKIQVVPLKGYAKAAKRATRFIVKKLGLKRSKEDEVTAACGQLGLTIGGYSSKLNLKLDPNTRADEATKQVCRQLLEIIEANADGACRQIDTEFLHDFRVAVRRTRSALARIRGVFPSPTVARFQRELRWLGQVTGPARDLDVYLLQIDDLQQIVPEPMRPPLAPLRPWLEAKHAAAYQDLVAAVGSPRYLKLLANWRTFLVAPGPKRSTLPNAQRPIVEVAREAIWRAYRRAIDDGRAINEESPSSQLHELRKTCKKLRYLLEFFRSLFPTTAMTQLIGALKALQANLGEIQDLEVQGDFIAAMSEPLHREESAATLMAIGVLVDQLRRRQTARLAEFAVVFGAFANQDNRKLARKLFKPTKDTGRRPS